ncbi:MAG: ParA family protein [Stappiaceae bacterium]
MRTILVANLKGGCGKTTIATTLATALAKNGEKVAIADADRQKSSLNWGKRRPKDAIPIAVLDWTKSGDVGDVAKKFDAVVIDGPGGLNSEMAKTLIAGSDTIVIPVLPSVLDLDSTRKFLKRIETLKRVRKGKADIHLVANRVKMRTVAIKELEQAAKGIGHPVLARLTDRMIYNSLAGQGLALFDRSSTELVPIKVQWQPLVSLLQR